MSKITDDGEIDYSSDDNEVYNKRKNDLAELELQAEIAAYNAETARSNAAAAESSRESTRQKNRTRIFVAVIKLVGVIFTAIVALFPVNSPGEPYKPVIVALAVAISGSNVDLTSENNELTPTLNVVETSVVQTLTSIAPTLVIVEPTTRIVTVLPGLPTETAVPTATATPTSTSLPPSPTPSPVLIDTIEVSGSSNTGVEFTAPQTGRYFFRFNSGGYCTHGTNPGFPTCLPTVWLFQSGIDLWEDDGRTLNQNNASRIIAPVSDCGAGRGAYCNTIAEAEAQGRNSGEVRMNLEGGSTWVLIGVDHREAYLDNPGTVFIDVFYQPEQ